MSWSGSVRGSIRRYGNKAEMTAVPLLDVSHLNAPSQIPSIFLSPYHIPLFFFLLLTIVLSADRATRRRDVQEFDEFQVYAASDRTAVSVDARGCSVEVQVWGGGRQAVVQ